MEDLNKSKEILIVEDSPTQAERLKYILDTEGYQVSVAHNGKEALALINKSRPTAVISDIVMPEMDGYELCRKIKADKDLRNIPVILLTSLSDPSDVVKALECGADNFLTKPYEERYLLSRLQYFLINQELHRANGIQMGLEILFQGKKLLINSDRMQILNLLLSTYEAAVQKNNELTKVQEELKRLNERLEEKVEERTADLKAEITERKRAEEEVQSLNVELEDRVVKRTAELEATNKELEAFSYSVSHDLRAPLRSIDGFSQALLEDYQDKLDDTAKSYLDRVRKATQHMGRLIDDMLKLSRVTRSEFHPESVDMSTMVREISEKLQQNDPVRTVDVIIREGVFVNGDSNLLKIALENLVNNAWKFTSKEARPQFEFGTTVKEGKTACFIRDNGVGFDMTYVNKLFGAFQRLHTSLEFPGTGIGLATVQRIINRHGGQVWAEAEVGKGATFYFTLPG